jgi:hypothetical protein
MVTCQIQFRYVHDSYIKFHNSYIKFLSIIKLSLLMIHIVGEDGRLCFCDLCSWIAHERPRRGTMIHSHIGNWFQMCQQVLFSHIKPATSNQPPATSTCTNKAPKTLSENARHSAVYTPMLSLRPWCPMVFVYRRQSCALVTVSLSYTASNMEPEGVWYNIKI